MRASVYICLFVALSRATTPASAAHAVRGGAPSGIQALPKLHPTDAYTAHINKIQGDVSRAEYDDLRARYHTLELKAGGKTTEEAAETTKKEALPDLQANEIADFHEGRIVAVGLMLSITLISVMFAMAQTANKEVKSSTWKMIDSVVAIFVAVMWFQAFDDLITDMGIVPRQYHVAASVLHLIVWLGVALSLAYVFRNNKTNLAVLCAVGAHIVSFASMHASEIIVGRHFDSTVLTCVVGLLVITLMLLLCWVALHYTKKGLGLLENDDFVDAFDDLEVDFAAMAVAVVWTLIVVTVITGEYDGTEDDMGDVKPVKERWVMLGYAVIMVLISGFAIKPLSKLAAAETLPTKRAGQFGTAFLSMSCAWAFLLLLEWQMHALVDRPVFGKVIKAHVATWVALGLIGLMSLSKDGNEAMVRGKQVVLAAASLIAAWSWEESFDQAMEGMAEGSFNEGVTKICAALGLGAIILPVYINYLKPITMKLDE